MYNMGASGTLWEKVVKKPNFSSPDATGELLLKE